MSWCGTSWRPCSGQSSGPKPRPPKASPALPLPRFLLLLTWLIASECNRPVLSGRSYDRFLKRGLPCERPAATAAWMWHLKSCGLWSGVYRCDSLSSELGVRYVGQQEGMGGGKGFSTTPIALATSSGAFPQFLVWIREFWALKCLLLKLSPQVVPSGCLTAPGWLIN